MAFHLEYRAACAIALAAALACAAACSDAGSHPSLVSPGGETHSSGGRSGASDGGAANGEAAGASDGGESGSAGQAGGAVSNPPAPALCSRSAVWADALSVANVSSGMSETLLSITPDELDLAFLRAGALYVAHRAAIGADFSVGAPITVATGWSAAQGASLSADGKRLILVGDPNQGKLGELTRTTRDSAFSGEVEQNAFADVNEDAHYSGRVYASPAVSPGDDQLFFNSSFPGGASTVVVSTRAEDGVWSPPTKLNAQVFDGAVNARRLPSGVSADERTLFYFNEESGQEEARFRDTADANAPLYDMLSLGKRRAAIPNSACDRLYSESDSDVVVEKD